MSNRNDDDIEETRQVENSDEEPAINPDVRILSRIFGVHRSSIASMPGTSGSGRAAAPAPGGSAPRRTPRQERDRLFWTLLGNSGRGPNRCRSGPARAPRPVTFADLLEPERRRARTALLARCASPAAYKPSTSYAGLVDLSWQGARRRAQDRLNLGSPGNGECAGACAGAGADADADADADAGSARPALLVRACAEPSEHVVAADEEEDSPPRDEAPAAGYLPDRAQRAEEPINMSTAERDEQDAPAPAPGASGDEQEATNGSGEPQQQARGTKRKREREGDTHESVSVLNKSILRLLECPVCMEWMEPPIAQCRRGHLVCGACRKRLDTCPVCRTPFSSVRNRAMEDVAGILRYPCRHGCGRELRAARRLRHEASCAARRHACPLPPCRAAPPMPRTKLLSHCQAKHPESFKTGATHRLSLGVSSEQHVQWAVSALGALFHVRVDMDVRAWGVLALVAHLGPVNRAPRYTYEVTVTGRHNGRRLVYRRATHSDLENSVLNTSRQDCFHLTIDQALNYLRFKNERSETDKTLELTIHLAEAEPDEEAAADSA